ncbi:MAG: hypothetical protein ACRDNL_04605 [Spirillospora sp.]
MRTSTPRRPILLSGALACGITVTFAAGALSPDRTALFTPAASWTPRPAIGGTIEEMPPRDGQRVIRPKAAPPVDGPRQRRAAGPLHRLAVSVLDRAGLPPGDAYADMFQVFDRATGRPVTGRFTGGTGQVEVPAGTYRVGAWIRTPEPGRPDAKALMIEPSVSVAGATSVALDARATKKVEVSLDVPDPKLYLGDVLVPMTTEGERHAYGLPLEDGLFVSPAAGMTFYVSSVWTRGGADRSPYRYSVLNTSKGQIPSDPTFRVRTADLATVSTKYPAQGRTGCVGIFSGPDLPDVPAVMSYGVVAGTTPGTHTVRATPGVLWRDDHSVGGADCTFEESEMTQGAERFPGPGHYTRQWHTAPLTPGLSFWNGRGDLVPAVVRRNDQLDVGMSLFSDGATAHVGPLGGEGSHITGRTTLTQDGRQLGSSPYAGSGSFTLPKGPGRYRLETSAERNAPWSPLATRTDAAWTFTSAPTDTATAPPLMAVRYDARLDDHSLARAGASHRISAKIQAPPGADAPDVRQFRVHVSYDDGKTWQRTTVREGDDGWTIQLHHPANAGYVSLRASAVDTEGNTVEQTTIRAYGLRT